MSKSIHQIKMAVVVMSHASNCVHMLMMLNTKPIVQTRELAEVLEVSERMVRKYKQDLEIAGIHIGTKPGRYGGYFLEQKTILPNVDFQAKEIAALDMAYDYIQKSHDFPDKNAFQLLYHHISTMSYYKEEVDQYLYFVHKSKPRKKLTKDNELFLQIRSAILSKKKIEINYQGWSGKATNRIIHPYGLVNYDNSWYCVAFCEKRQEMRTFKLMRIQELTEIEETFVPNEGFNFREDKLGLFNDEHDVELLIYPPFSYTIDEEIWGENQEITKNEDGSVRFESTMFGKEAIVKWVLSMGSGAKVIGPESIREAVKEKLKKSLERYSD